MINQDHFTYLWPTLFGSFYNPDHFIIKNELIKYIEEYKKNSSIASLSDSIRKNIYI